MRDVRLVPDAARHDGRIGLVPAQRLVRNRLHLAAQCRHRRIGGARVRILRNAGRADDFAWPRRVVLPLGTDPIVATSTTPITPMQPYETRQAAVAPAAAPAQRIGPPAPPRQAATAPAQQQQRQTSFFGGWGQSYQQQQAQQQQRGYQRTQQPFFFPFFGGR